MLFRLGDLEDPLTIEDNADRLSDLTWKITAVVLEDLQDLKATRMARASHRALKAGSPVVALNLLRSRCVMLSAK
jgi:hypothetical protein